MDMTSAYNVFRANMGNLDATYECRFETEVKTVSDIKNLNKWYEDETEYLWCDFMANVRKEIE